MAPAPMSTGELSALLIAAAHVMLAVGVSAHIVLTKNDVRAAIGWAGLVWLTPVVGSLLYILFGINRIRRRAGRVRGKQGGTGEHTIAMRVTGERPLPVPSPFASDAPKPFAALARLVGSVTRLPLTDGNLVEPLFNGDEAYPAMIAAIDGATSCVALATYIFDRGVAGAQFVDALGRAVRRGVEVRVLVDGVGSRYSRPPIVPELRRHGVTVAQFLPTFVPLPHPYFNLRNHRKMLVVDGSTAFCGGMNIRDACLLELRLPTATQDMHFRLRGPVVRHLMSAFAFDWEFTTREPLAAEHWWPALHPAGDVIARGIADGPDEDFEALLMTILGAVGAAERSIRIVTPYFLPDASVLNALRVAAMRGVRVEVVLPERGNLRLVQWAATAQLPQVLAAGCRVHLSRPPFDHSKLFVVDGAWSLVGSANWDPRSLRLNFEYDVECYSTTLATRLDAVIDAKIAASRALSAGELQRLPLGIRLRNGGAWLAQPYL